LTLGVTGRAAPRHAQVVVVKRGLQKKRMTNEEIQEAIRKKNEQKKSVLETYYKKWGQHGTGKQDLKLQIERNEKLAPSLRVPRQKKIER